MQCILYVNFSPILGKNTFSAVCLDQEDHLDCANPASEICKIFLSFFGTRPNNQ